MKQRLLLLAAAAICLIGQAQAGTYAVHPGESIQQAINLTGSGDTVLVYDGTYYPDSGDFAKIIFPGHNITLKSVNGPDFTTIRDGELRLVGGQTRSARVEGFTFTQDGMFWEYGIRFDTSNTGQPSSGTVINCRFRDAVFSGIGALHGATPLVQNCEFIRVGHADWFGGGIYSYYNSHVEVDHCYFEETIATGGALFAEWSARITADFCTFVHCGDQEPFASNWETESSAMGTAGVQYDGRIDLTSCTIFGSYASTGGSAVEARDGTVNLDRCIVAYSREPEYGGETFLCYGTGAINLSCCDVFGNVAGDFADCVAGQSGSNNNFSLNPLFCDTATLDVNLQESSPCVSHAPCGQVGSLGSGCTGYLGPFWHVATTGNDSTGDGTEPNPFATIQHAIDQSSNGDYIMVHNGVFSGPGNRLIDYHGKQVTVQSEFGADSTTIDCDSLRGFIFDNHEDTNFVLMGLKITNGSEEAVWCDNAASPLIQDCIFEQNIRGITCRDSASPVIRRCVFRDNYIPDGHGGGGIGTGAAIYCMVGIDTSGVDSTRRSNPTIDSCVFEGNRATRGAAIYCYESQPVITRSLFLRNGFTDTIGVGSGIFVSDGPGPTVTQCTFYGNFGSTGAAVGVQLNGWINLDKCVFAGNVVRSNGIVVFCDHAGFVNLTCSNVYGNAVGDYTGCIAGLEGVDGNISEDPVFCNAPADEFGLRGHSPCVPGHPLNTCGDFMGAYTVNCDGPVWIISPTGDDLVGDGTFAAPWGSIQHGIDQADSADTVMLTAGTFTGTGNRLASFGGKELVLTSYYGADSTVVDAENFNRILSFDQYEDSNSVVHGLTLSGASEAAIYCDSSAPTLSYCTFTLNDLAVDCWRDSDSKIEYCDFVNNSDIPGSVAGIGIHFASPTIYRCLFEGNSAGSGGAIYVAGNTASPDITECRFIRNGYPLYQTSKGAGVQALTSAHPTVTSCTFYGNMAVWGSALYLQDANISVENSVVAFNDDGFTGYSVYCLGNGDIDLFCCNIYGNRKGDYHDCIGEEEFQDGNFSANPLFCDTAGGNFHLAANSRCAAANNGCGVVIGALDTACAAQANTGTGTDVGVNAGEGVNVTFDEVTGEGNTDVVMQTGGDPPPDGFATVPSDPTTYYNISTTALYTGDIQICVSYDEADLTTSEHKLTLQHYDGVNWLDITTSRDMLANIICGVSPSLSPFILAQDTMPNTAPGLFSRLLPADSAVVARDSVVLTWSGCIDPDGDFVTYDLAISVAGIDTLFTISDTVLTLDLTGWGLPSGQEDVTWSVYAEDGIDSTAAANGSGMFVVDATVGVDDGDPAIIPNTYALSQNYPNPFNPQTEIRFALPEPASVELVIFNMLGQEVRTLVRRELPAGYHVVGWNGRDVLGLPAGSGVYFYRLTAGDYIATKKMLLLK